MILAWTAWIPLRYCCMNFDSIFFMLNFNSIVMTAVGDGLRGWIRGGNSRCRGWQDFDCLRCYRLHRFAPSSEIERPTLCFQPVAGTLRVSISHELGVIERWRKPCFACFMVHHQYKRWSHLYPQSKKQCESRLRNCCRSSGRGKAQNCWLQFCGRARWSTSLPLSRVGLK